MGGKEITVRFSTSNAKLEGQGYAAFNLPAGYSCPCARDCKTFANPKTGKITDRPQQKFRCLAASLEWFPGIRNNIWHNFNTLKAARTAAQMYEILARSLPYGWRGFRWHAGGDFFSYAYFRAFLKLAEANNDKLFYAYTKSLGFWVRADHHGLIPENVVLTASRGGEEDHLIDKYSLREAIVVNHPEEAKALGLELDHDDSLARDPSVKVFALLIHGTQVSGSTASDALKRLRKEGIKFSYTRKKK